MYKIEHRGFLPAYAHNSPYDFTRLWDRKICVSFDTIDTDLTADYRVLVQCESPELFCAFESMVMENHENFDLILTYYVKLLPLPRARLFVPVTSWVDEIEIDKIDQISYVMSSKVWTGHQRMRFMILRQLENQQKINDFDFLMHRSPPYAPSKNMFFSQAKFNIACENQVMENMFTEKLLDCFRTYTIPIYYGCTNISEYFDVRGMLCFNTIDQFMDILQDLTPSAYDHMLPYARQNREAAREYWEKTVYQRIEEQIARYLYPESDSQ